MGPAKKKHCPISRFAFYCSWAAVIAVLVTLSLPSRCDAQVLYGSIVGQVTDPTGAAVPGATATIINNETNQSREAKTDTRGAYSFINVRGGTFTVKVAQQGFKTYEKSGVTVTLNAVTRVDVQLEIGAVTESVTVSAEVPLLQTDTAEVHANVTTTEVQNLPVPLGRNYQQLYRALPGFTPPQNSHSIPTNPARALEFNVNGTSDNQNNTRVDGVSTYNIQLPHVNSYIPTLESIQEVNAVTNTFDAEQGFAAGVAINVETKSGSNDFHGSLFEYHSDQHTKAWPMQFENADVNVGNKPKFIDNSFGGTVGGPIKKDKLFFFVSYEGDYQRQTAQRTNTILTEAMRAGDFRSSLPDVLIYDPLTGDQVTGMGRTQFVASADPNDPNYNAECTDIAGCPNVIPENRLDPIAQDILSFIPPTNRTGDSRNFYSNGAFKWNRNQVDSKVNYNATDKLNLIGTFGFLRYSTLSPTIFGEQAIGRLIGPGGNPGDGSGDTYRATIMGTYSFTPGFLMDAHFGYSKQGTNSVQRGLGTNVGSDVLGIPGTNGTRDFESGWPEFDISSFDTIGVPSNYMPYYRHDPQYQYVANFNWIKGDHNIRFGTDLYRQTLNHTQAEFLGDAYGASGGFNFGRGVTQTCTALDATDPTLCVSTSSNSRSNSGAAFMLGLPDTRSRTLLAPDSISIRAMLYSAYLRDRWNITPKLTADFGIRWEYYPVITRPDRGIEHYDFDTNQVLLCGLGSTPKDCGIKTSKKHFAPRIGFAYRATNTLVFRTGYGITTDPYEALEIQRANYPLLAALNQTDDRGDLFPVGTLEDGIPAITSPDTSSGAVDMPGNVGYGGWPDTFQRGYVQSWNFIVQKQLPANFTGQVGYVATRSVKQLAFMDFNAGQVVGAGKDGQPLFSKFGRDANTILIYPVGNGHYDSLQATLQRRFSNGLALTVNYTWSKAINAVNNAGDGPEIQVFDYLYLNRSRTGFDRTHNMSITNVWALPFGKGKRWASNGGAASAVLGGWQFNSLISAMTGVPFTVYGSGSGFNTPGSSQTADQVGSVQKLGGIGVDDPFYDPSAFADPNAARFGTSGFNILSGPGLFNWDFGLFREFSITERYKLQFRMESFNFTNTPHFDTPDGDVTSDTFMAITGLTNLAREGIDERQFRFGLRFSF
jgi:Carboxypeptidase regulatory-like domain/TonB dependent receptor-like, beta-barrel